MTIRIAHGLSLPIGAVTEKLGFIGRTGSGKTYAAQKLAEEMHRVGAQFVALDPVGKWWSLRLAADGKTPSIPVPVFGGLHGDVPLEPTAGKLMADVIVDRGISAVVDVSQFESDAAKSRFMTDFGNRFFFRKKAAPSAVHLFIEECQEFVPQNPQRDEGQMLHAWTRIQKLGRNFGIGSSLLSQRPQEVNKKVLNQTEVLFVFQLTGNHERKSVAAWIEDKGLNEDIAAELPKLEQGCPHVWSPAWLKISKVVRIAAKTTFDASATPEVGRRSDVKELAPIDLEKLRTDMAATIERAKAEDPRELRKRIAVLEGELRKAKAAPAIVHPGPEEIAKIRDAVLWEIQKKLVTPLEHLEKEALIISSVGETLLRLHKDFWKEMPLQPTGILSAHPSTLKHPGQFSEKARKPESQIPLEIHRAPEGRREYPSTSSLGESGLKRMLIALAQRNGLTARQLGLRAGLSSKSGTFSTYLGRARSSGWINGSRDRIEITEAGRAAIGSHDPLPEGRDLLEYWLGQLGNSGAARMLRVLADRYPRATAAEELGEAAELSAGSGTFSTYLGRLRTLELVTGSKSDLRASEELFG